MKKGVLFVLVAVIALTFVYLLSVEKTFDVTNEPALPHNIEEPEISEIEILEIPDEAPVVLEDAPKDVILSSEQKDTLESFGVDPASVPATIPVEQEKCFRNELGSDRVDEIFAGDVPSLLEMVRAKNCIEN